MPNKDTIADERKQEILREARERLKWCMADDDDNRQKALEDLEFIGVDGKQWPEDIRKERENNGRPCITTNKMPTFVDQVVGDQRQNRPSLHAIPVDDKGDKKTALIYDGWIKNVFHISVADSIIDHAFEHSVSCGYGAWRVVTKYASDDMFEQDAMLEKISNALSVWWGPHVNYDCSDAPYCFLVSDMLRVDYKDKYGKDGMPFNTADSQYIEGWCTQETIRIAEYFVKEKETKTIYLMPDGRVVDDLSKEDGTKPVKEREVDGYKIMWYLLTGDDIMDHRRWVGKKYIPVVPVWGKELNVGGKRVVRGLIRNAKDPQRMYNFWQSSDTELVALAPKTPYLVTPSQIQNHETQWNEAHKKNFPYLLVNPDERAPGWPHREAPPQASTAMVAKLQQADQEIRDTMGLQKASLGMQSNERSGKAIIERKREGDVGTFAFIDNLVRSIEYTGRILMDVAPYILDTNRIIRLGLDNGKFKAEAINVPAKDERGNAIILNDMTVGKYDVICKVGPSFATQRSEARQSMSDFIQYVPAAAPMIADLLADAMDWPHSEEIADRLTMLLPPEIRAMKAKKDAEESGGTESEAPPPTETPPDPMQQMQMAKMQGELTMSQLKLKQQEIVIKQEEAKLAGILITNELAAREPTEVRQFTNITPGRAEGGPVKEDKPYVVGEKGPEVIIPEQDGTVMPPFDPDSADYDYATAIQAGLAPDDTGHWPSRDPKTGRILKGVGHPTFDLTVKGEADAGYEIVKGEDGYYYSFPKGGTQ